MQAQRFGVRVIHKKVWLFVHVIMVIMFCRRRGGVSENEDR